MLFDWLVVGQVIATNPAAPVRGPHCLNVTASPINRTLLGVQASLLRGIKLLQRKQNAAFLLVVKCNID